MLRPRGICLVLCGMAVILRLRLRQVLVTVSRREGRICPPLLLLDKIKGKA